MATTLRFVLLGDDRASQAFSRFARQVDQTNGSLDRNRVALSRQSKAQDSAAGSILKLTGTITGFGDAQSAASKKATIFTKVLAGFNLATGLAEPLISSLVVAVGALGSSLAVAGAGLGAYGIAAAGVVGQVTKLEKAQALAAKGSKAQQQAYQKLLQATSGPVKQFTKQLDGVRHAYQQWSTSLARPVLRPLAVALGTVQPILHALTPLVRAAGSALTTVVTELSAQIHGGGVERIVTRILPYVRPVIIDLAHAIENVVAGLGGILGAFLPFSTKVTGGLVDLTKRFRDWGTTLSGHTGFHAIVNQWRQDWPIIKPVLSNLLQIFKNVVSDLSAMATPANSKALWQIANPLTALALTLSTHPALVTALAYLLLIGKGGRQIKTVFDSLKTGWGTVSAVLAKLTGGRIGSIGGGMQAAGDTMAGASKGMNTAADKMLTAAGKLGEGAAAEGAGAAAGGGAASRVEQGGIGGLLARIFGGGAGAGAGGATLGVAAAIAAASKIHLPGQKTSVLQFDLQSFHDRVEAPLLHAWQSLAPKLGSVFTPGGAVNQSVLRGWDHVTHGLLSSITSAFTPGGALNMSMRNGGGHLVDGLWGGVKTAWGVVSGFFSGLPARSAAWFHGADKWLVSGGKNLITGAWHGIQDLWRTVSGWAGGLESRTQGWFRGAAGWLLASGRNVFTGLWHGVSDIWHNITSWLGGMPGRFNGMFRGALSWLLQAGRNVIWGLYHGLLDIWDKVTSFITGIPGWIKSHKGPIGLDQKLLVPAGRAIMESLHTGLLLGSGGPLGFISGLAGDIGSLLSQGISGLVGKLVGGGAGAGVQRWAPLVAKVLAMLGLPASYLGPWLSQMNTESGGRVNAINLSDINAKMGDPSRGLLQVIMSTFLAYAGPFRSLGIYNPLANVFAAINYALHRYGRAGMLAVIGHGHGYETGSWSVPKTGPATVHRGEMILPQPLAEAVRQVLSRDNTRGGRKEPALLALTASGDVYIRDPADAKLRDQQLDAALNSAGF